MTGSAQCLLGPYWAAALGRTRLCATQLSARGGVLRVRVGGTRVGVGGRASTVFVGELAGSAAQQLLAASWDAGWRVRVAGALAGRASLAEPRQASGAVVTMRFVPTSPGSLDAAARGAVGPSAPAGLRALVQADDPSDARERSSKERFLVELDRLVRPFERDADPVHVTASAVVAGVRGTALHRHRRLGRWLQPGGHVDPDELVEEAAVRELLQGALPVARAELERTGP